MPLMFAYLRPDLCFENYEECQDNNLTTAKVIKVTWSYYFRLYHKAVRMILLATNLKFSPLNIV